MQIIHGTTEFEIEGKNAVAIGKFDGIHLGHQKLLQFLLEQKEIGRKTVIFTFDPPPAVLFGSASYKELMTTEEKRAAFEKMGIDVLIEYPLSYETAAIIPEDFIENILVKRVHAVYIAAGTDVSFGAGGAGNYMLLKSMAPFNGYEIQVIDKVCYEGREVSSTLIREDIEQGRMEEAGRLLGNPYSVRGTVMHGNRFGRTIGMPTVNLLPPARKMLPPNGVYYSEVVADGIRYAGITNIGFKPTVSAEKQLGAETYIYDFDREIYGEDIQVSLLRYKRPEQKFAGTEELKAQMMRDIEEGKLFHKSYK